MFSHVIDRQSSTAIRLVTQLDDSESYLDSKAFVLVLKENPPHTLLEKVLIPFDRE